MNLPFLRIVSSTLIVSLLSLGLPAQSAVAGLVGTHEAASAQSQPERERIRAFLERVEVQAQLQRQGIDPAEAQARVDALTDDEVQRVAGKLDQLPAGGDILGVLLTVFIVLLITDILGFTKVFSFTRPIK